MAEIIEAPSKALLGRLFSFFCPVHYRLGMDMETLMCQGRISRKQAAILWLVHSNAGNSGWLRRKEIEERLSTWFEITNSNISVLLRELTKPPLSLLTQVENPENGREKVVRLTLEGEAFLNSMINASIDYLARNFDHLSDKDIAQGVIFFETLFRQSSELGMRRD